MSQAVKENPFTVIAERLRTGSTVRILPSFISVARLHEGRYGTICKVTNLYDYAERQESYLYYVLIDNQEWPYGHGEVEAVG